MGKVAVVTGAAGGLGAAAVRRLVDEGVRVVAADLNQAAVEAVVDELPEGCQAIAVGCDVSEPEGIARYVDAALDAFGTLDLHFLNAGIAGTLADLTEVSVDEWDRVSAVNLRGPFLGLQAALRRYLETGTSGSIVITASIAGLRGSNDLLAYTTTKHGTVGLVHGAAVYAGPLGVRVNGIAPGIVPTPLFGDAGRADMIERARTCPLRRAGTPDEIASAVAFLLSDDASYITGHILSIDGGASVQSTARRGGGAGLWDPAAIDAALLARRRK